MPSADAESGKASRRTHRKSRMGCSFCRRRRIKCDEKKPACTNCVKRTITCEYTTKSAETPHRHLSPSSSWAEPTSSGASEPLHTTPAPAQNSSSNSRSLNLTDLELLHAWGNSTAPSVANSMSTMDHVHVFWRVTVPEIGFSYPFVLHGTLAISAMHLARFRRARDQFYRSEAESHWNQGFSMTTSQIPQVGNESYHAFYIFSMLSCIYKLAKGPAPGDFLYFEEPGRESSEWLIYCKGHLSFLMFGLDALRTGPLAQLFEISTQKTRKFFTPDDPVDPDPIADLRKLCKDALGPTHPKYDTYKAAIDNLSRMYSALYDSEDDGDFSIFVWMLSISKEFFPCIQQRDPVALVIFAYFVVLLDKLSPWWVLDGWTHHLMFGIYNALSIGTKQWIRWPMEKTGWIPPCMVDSSSSNTVT